MAASPALTPGPEPPERVTALLCKFSESDYEAALAIWRECGLIIKRLG